MESNQTEGEKENFASPSERKRERERDPLEKQKLDKLAGKKSISVSSLTLVPQSSEPSEPIGQNAELASPNHNWLGWLRKGSNERSIDRTEPIGRVTHKVVVRWWWGEITLNRVQLSNRSKLGIREEIPLSYSVNQTIKVKQGKNLGQRILGVTSSRAEERIRQGITLSAHTWLFGGSSRKSTGGTKQKQCRW